MAHKDFTRAVAADGAEKRPPEPITFNLPGDPEPYVALPKPPAAAISDVAISASGEGPEQIAAIMQFMDLVLEPDSAVRFGERMRERDIGDGGVFELDEVMEVFTWLMEQYAPGRPTGGSSESPSGSNRATRRSLTAGAPRRVSNPLT
jgi:hypothetical protein